MAITTLSGTNKYLIQKQLAKLVGGFSEKFGALSVSKIDCEEVDYQQITEEIHGVSLLTPQRMVVLKSPSKNKQLPEDFDTVLANIPDSTELIIVEHAIDKRSKMHKTLKAKTEFIEYSDIAGSPLVDWVMQTALAYQAKINYAAARYLVERVGTNQQTLDNELAKLASYALEITKDSIDQLTEPTSTATIFNLLDHAFSGNSKKALEIYTIQRSQKVDPSKILSMLGWQLHILAIIKTSADKTSDAIAKDAKLSPFVVQKSMLIAKKISMARLKELISDLVEVDYKIKSTKVNADSILQNFLMDLGKK